MAEQLSPYIDPSKPNQCVFCNHATMDDVCCVRCEIKAKKNSDGTCDKFEEYRLGGQTIEIGALANLARLREQMKEG